MKREEAIKLLNDIHSQCCDTANILCTLDADKRCDALQMAITALQNQPVWIPVSERLPEYGEVVLCSCTNAGITVSAITFKGLKRGKVVQFGQHYVTAWMPLPEPYRESEV